MGALALIDSLSIGGAVELASQRGERVMATGVAGGGAATQSTLTAAFVQPAVGSTVPVSVSSTDGSLPGGFVTIPGGGRYIVTVVTGPTAMTLANIGGPENVAPATIVASPAPVSLQSPELANVVGGKTPYSLGTFVNVMDPIFGAVGDGVHDDTAAFTAFVAACIAQNATGFVPTPANFYNITAEIPVNGAARIVGQTTNGRVPCLRATASMRSIVALRSTAGLSIGQTLLAYDRAYFEAINFDANGQAHNGVILLGSEFTTFKDCVFQNATQCGIRNAKDQLASTLSAVTPTVPGGSPPGVTVSQPDPNYEAIAFIGVGTPPTWSLVLKVTGGGTTYQTSYDGGATFNTFNQPLPAGGLSGLAVGAVGSNAGLSSGVVVDFPAGTYHDGDTYAFTLTYNYLDFVGFPGAANADVRYDDCVFLTCGSVFHSAGYPPVFGGYNSNAIAGTVAIASGSLLVTGTGTSFMSAVTGAGSARMALTINGVGSFLVAAVLDDTHLALVPGTAPATTASGLDFALGTYGGMYEDGLGDGLHAQWLQGTIGSCTMGAQFAGAFGPNLLGVAVQSAAFYAFTFGTGQFDQTIDATVHNCHLSSDVNIAYYLAPTSGGVLLNPRATQSFAGVAANWSWHNSGTFTQLAPNGAASLVPLSNLQIIQQPVVLASHSSTIPAPTNSGGSVSANSRVSISSALTGVIQLDGTPIIAPGVNGQVLRVVNGDAGKMYVFNDNLTNLPGLSGVLLAGSSKVRLNYLEEIEFSWDPTVLLWRQTGFMSRANSAGGSVGGGAGNCVTTTDATLTEIYRALPAVSGGNGLGLRFDVIARSAAGGLLGWWSGNSASFTAAVATAGFVLGPATGSNAGAPPAGWAPSTSSDGTHAFVNVQASSNNASPITWTIDVWGIEAF